MNWQQTYRKVKYLCWMDDLYAIIPSQENSVCDIKHHESLLSNSFLTPLLVLYDPNCGQPAMRMSFTFIIF